MTCGTPEWVIDVFPWVAFFSAGLALDVMQNTEHDEINKVDPVWVQWLRRIGFIAMAFLLGLSIYYAATSQASSFWFSLFWVFLSGTYSLAINDIALRLRPEPPDDSGIMSSSEYFTITSRHLAESIASAVSEVQADVHGLDRGQQLTHKLLQAILRNQQMTPDSAIDATVVVPFMSKKK